jgi:methionyl aminopeptidase
MSNNTATVSYKTAEELAIMREAGRIVAKAHAAMREALRPGISTKELDTIAETVLRDHDAIPAFLGYAPNKKPPFPGTITASINNELVHGIPSSTRILKEGDIIGLDTACFYKGYVGDAAYSYAIGEVSPAVKRLLQKTEEGLYEAINASVIGNKISDVAKATMKFASKHGYSVATDYTGHGVGQKMHEPPQVPNFWLAKKPKIGQPYWQDYEIKAGMTYAIEPMFIMGRNELKELGDQWTVVTKDGSLCAHFEHTIAITENGPEILTLL